MPSSEAVGASALSTLSSLDETALSAVVGVTVEVLTPPTMTLEQYTPGQEPPPPPPPPSPPLDTNPTAGLGEGNRGLGLPVLVAAIGSASLVVLGMICGLVRCVRRRSPTQVAASPPSEKASNGPGKDKEDLDEEGSLRMTTFTQATTLNPCLRGSGVGRITGTERMSQASSRTSSRKSGAAGGGFSLFHWPGGWGGLFGSADEQHEEQQQEERTTAGRPSRRSRPSTTSTSDGGDGDDHHMMLSSWLGALGSLFGGGAQHVRRSEARVSKSRVSASQPSSISQVSSQPHLTTSLETLAEEQPRDDSFTHFESKHADPLRQSV